MPVTPQALSPSGLTGHLHPASIHLCYEFFLFPFPYSQGCPLWSSQPHSCPLSSSCCFPTVSHKSLNSDSSLTAFLYSMVGRPGLCGCPSPGSFPGQTGRSLEQPGLVEGVRVGARSLQSPFQPNHSVRQDPSRSPKGAAVSHSFQGLKMHFPAG